MGRFGGVLIIIFLAFGGGFSVRAQPSVLHRPTLAGGLSEINAQHFGVEFVLPELHKWYSPRNLFETYTRPWYVRDTNYADGTYRRYVDQLLEGSQWYDRFGTELGRGWLVYSWTQLQASSQGSRIMKRPSSPDRRDTYSSFFSRLVVAKDGDSRGNFRLMIGDEIYTLFTPLTFYKPRFNGLRMDYSNDLIKSSFLLSRPSEPNRDSQTDITNFMAAHVDFDASDMLTFGLTFVNGHNARTKEDFASGNPFAGVLTTKQNQALEDLWVSIKDDSPTRGTEGPTLFSYDVVFTDTSGSEFRGSEISFLPFVEGGRAEGSTLIASGGESLLLHYDMNLLNDLGYNSNNLKRARVELSIANDYRIDMASNLQTDGARRRPEPVFLTTSRALGNVEDRSNGRILALDYSLPTANEILGFNWDLRDWNGLSTIGELALNRQYSQYPSPNISRGHEVVRSALAAYAVGRYARYPWSIYAEGFSIAAQYSSRYWLTDASGAIKYKDDVPQLYEFVDDDDDFDAIPDWERPFQPWSNSVWPGYDENGDFLYDHNQNNNFYPDYLEPFLRYRSDRPEYLFGFDMNNNGTIDRFEDDDSPDYPFDRDLIGLNFYLMANITPDMVGVLGRQNMRQLSGDGITRSWYGLFSWIHQSSWGTLRVFEHAKSVKDNIPNHINRWVQPVGALGRMRGVIDELPSVDAWQNVLYADWKFQLWKGTQFFNRLKWDARWQRQSISEVQKRGGRPRSHFVGLINKGEWSVPIGLSVLEPRIKSELRREKPYSSFLSTSTIAEQTLFVIWTQPIMAESVGVAYFPRYGRQQFNTQLQLGIELGRIRLLEGQSEEIRQNSHSWNCVMQLTNRVGYLGYKLVLRTGFRLGNKGYENGDSDRSSLFFLTVNAGL
ncbi:MAG: hypothetical protein VX294_08825 [Candidatus Latescibacterota bacterium]|nr:hypothetical protein [Candidatus Latescibacterota bacterium]